MSDTFTTNADISGEPQALVHRKILDVAEEQPNISIEEIADNVNGASPDLVERVLEKYGDPADEADESETAVSGTADESESDPKSVATDDEQVSTSLPDHDQLTEKQRELLRAIRDRPEATQAELAEQLGLNRTTITKRANSIDGFDWQQRRRFVEEFYGESVTTERGDSNGTSKKELQPYTNGGTELETGENENSEELRKMRPSKTEDPTKDLVGEIDELAQRIDDLKQTLEGQSTRPTFDDPELASRIVLTCVNSDRFTEEEELQIVRRFLERQAT